MTEAQLIELGRLFETMAALRAPEGCPWDLAQTHRSLLPYLLEETYEFIEAVEEGHDVDMAEELGDLLVEVAMHTAIAADRGAFELGEVASRAAEKMVARHPHVFADTHISSAEQLLTNWDRAKRSEKPQRTSALDGIPDALPALALAASVQRRAARASGSAGAPAVDEVRERLELAAGQEQLAPGREELIGSLLFSVVRLAGEMGVDPEGALRRATRSWSTGYRDGERAAGSQPSSRG